MNSDDATLICHLKARLHFEDVEKKLWKTNATELVNTY
jgi:hypothetical protein